jgi:hypothetical protein
MTEYGKDVSTYPDLDPTFAWREDRLVVAWSTARRLETYFGQLEYAPTDGLDLRGFLHKGLDALAIFQIGASIEAECLKDERVVGAVVDLAQNTAAESITIKIELETADETFTLVLAIDSVSAKILSVT